MLIKLGLEHLTVGLHTLDVDFGICELGLLHGCVDVPIGENDGRHINGALEYVLEYIEGEDCLSSKGTFGAFLRDV